MSKKIICEILLEMEVIIKESSTKDQVARQLHGYFDKLKSESFEHFEVEKVTGDYNFLSPEIEEIEQGLKGNPDKMIKV